MTTTITTGVATARYWRTRDVDGSAAAHRPRAVGVGSAWPVAAEVASRGHSVHIGRPNAGRGAGRRRSAAGSAGAGCRPEMWTGSQRELPRSSGICRWRYPARRFGGRGDPLADVTQVAAIGLIKAVDRYDAARGVPHSPATRAPPSSASSNGTSATAGWNVRAPRRIQELGPRLVVTADEL